MKSTTAESTCNTSRTLFPAYGLPEEVVLDNRPQFTAAVFKNFLKKNGVKQTLVAPYHPASNGAAERLVQILKRNLKKQVLESHNSLSVSHKLANFLFAFRNTPHTVTGETPALMLLKRSPGTRLSLLHPNVAEAVESQQQRQQKYHGSLKLSLQEFKRHDAVQVRMFRGGTDKWQGGIIVKRLGPLNYLVKTGDQTKKVHVDHLLAGSTNVSDPAAADVWDVIPLDKPITCSPAATESSPHQVDAQTEGSRHSRYPQRDRRPVKCFELI